MPTPTSDGVPSLDGVYFLHPSNRLWLKSGQGHLVTMRSERTRLFMLVVGALLLPCGAVFLAVALLTASETHPTPTAITGLACVVGASLLMLVAGLRGGLDFTAQALAREGKVLIGEIVSVNPAVDWAVSFRGRHYVTELRYRFTTPEGVEVTQTRKIPFSYSSLPLAGRKIAILYVGTIAHEIL